MNSALTSPFNALFGAFSRDISIDLGTANTLVLVRGRGITINEPSVVAIERRSKRVLAIGSEAKQMVGRTPADIIAIRPLRDGVISDFDVTEAMLTHFIRRVHDETILPVPHRPRIVVSRSIRVAGDEMDEEIIRYAREKYNLLIGERMAEQAKIEIGSAYPLHQERTMVIRGRNLITGLPESIEISSVEVREALVNP